MTGARRRGLNALIAVSLAMMACKPGGAGPDQGPREKTARPELLLLTSLPIAFGESFSLDAAGSPVLDALEQHYRVRTIATSSQDALKGASLLLMAHPLAQPAEDLVALDDWVRKGGKLVLLADPRLEWADSRALGDPTRPPPMFMDTGLLKHWGLRLDAPAERGSRVSMLAEHAITTQSPGAFHGSCQISADRIVATCRIGKGTVLMVADADFLDWTRDQGAQGASAVLAALDSLDRG